MALESFSYWHHAGIIARKLAIVWSKRLVFQSAMVA